MIVTIAAVAMLLASQPPERPELVSLGATPDGWHAISVAPDGLTLDAGGIWDDVGTADFLTVVSGDWTDLIDLEDQSATLGPPTLAVCLSAARTQCGVGNVCKVKFTTNPVENICEIWCGAPPCSLDPQGTNPVFDPPLWMFDN